MKKAFLVGVLSVVVLAPQVSFAQFMPATGGTGSSGAGNYQPTVNPTATFNVPTPASTSSGGSCSTLTTTGLSGLVNCIIGILNSIMYVIMAAAVVYIVWGAFKMISEEGRDAGKAIVMYGIIGLFAMISIWGFVNILQKTFNLTGTAVRAPVILAP